MGQDLDEFQYDTLRFLDHAHGRAVVADPMGARKTGTILAWLAQQPAQRTLVVAPSSVHQHWAREAARFHPAAIVKAGVKGKAKRHEAIAACAANADEGGAWPTVYVTTYEAMKEDQHHIEMAHFDCVVFDEGHRLKGRRTNVALCANRITSKPAHVILATGTPVLNHAAELWQYLHMIAPKVYTAFWTWAEEHYVIEAKYFRGNRFPTRVIHGFRPGHEEIVRNQIAPFFIQRDIADLFPGQPWVEEPEHVEIPVDLSPAERKLYDGLVKNKWAVIGGGHDEHGFVDPTEIITKNSLDLTTRLTQITSDWGNVHEDADAGTKVNAAIELCVDLRAREEQVLIFAKYKTTVHRIVSALVERKIAACAYTGDVPQDTRDRDVQAFKAGRLKVIVGTLDSLSEGVDGLQENCANIIMVDRHWTPAKNDQAIGRLRRSGQVRKVTVYHIYALATIDSTITAACLRKTNVIQMLKGKPLIDAIYGRV